MNSAKPYLGLPFFLAVAIALATGNPSHADLTIANYSNAANDRFTNDVDPITGDFIAKAYDLSGVARSLGAGGKWGTLISANAVLTAHHFPAPIGQTFRFYQTNDPGGPFIDRTVVSEERVGDTDLRIQYLNSNVTPGYKIYDIETTNLSSAFPGTAEGFTIVSASTLQNEFTLMVGLGRTGLPTVSGTNIDQAYGTNRVSGYSEDVKGAAIPGNDNDSLILDYNTADEFHEARVFDGDSGAPAFRIVGGELVLLGTNSFRYANGSGIAYVGNKSDVIQAAIAANAVPEPGAIAFCCGLMMAGLLQRRR